MKSVLLSGLLLIGLTSSAQNVLRVNNTAGVNVPYTTIAAAVAAAGVNDIIMVEGSLTVYAGATINKKVTIIGPGYFLNENIGLQPNTLAATVNAITLGSGADGSVISGLNWNGQDITLNSASNVNISNCYASIAFSGTGTNIIIKGCYLWNVYCAPSATYSGIIISNNFIQNSIGQDSGSSSFSIVGNTFNGTGNCLNCNVRNNIFIQNLNNLSGATVKNNVFVPASQSGADGTNYFGATSTTLFLGLPGNTTDTQWKLKLGSPAIGFGEGGIDCGMYGGATPYKPSGIATGQHTIYSLAVPATTPQNGTMNVQVSAKVN